jgi:XRE family transcriptional regulator, regulator of sulfur utilization
MELGEKLRVLRKARKLTLLDVSREVDLSVSFLSDLERGRTRPSLDTLEKLASYYKVSVTELLPEVSPISAEPISRLVYPPGLEDFLRDENISSDDKTIELLLLLEQRAPQRASKKEDWKRYYYILKALYPEGV